MTKEKEKKEIEKRKKALKGKWVKMNFDHGGYKEGDSFFYDTAPEIIQMWAYLPGIKLDKKVVTILDEDPKGKSEKKDHDPHVCKKCGHIDGQPLGSKKTLAELNQEKIAKLSKKSKSDETVYCKGIKPDKEPCKRTKLIKGTDYCFQHQPKQEDG